MRHAAAALLLLLTVACSSSDQDSTGAVARSSSALGAAGQPLAADAAPRARLLAAVPPEALGKGVYVLSPADAQSYPGSPFDALLPTEEGTLLVEAPAAPLVLLGGLKATVPVGEPALEQVLGTAGRTALLVPPAQRSALLERLAGDPVVDPALARLAATTAPFAWLGPVGEGGQALVTLEPGLLRAELTGIPLEEVQESLAGGLPGSPGKLWTEVLGDLQVQERDGVVLVTGVPRDLPPPLLRLLLDQASGAV